MSWYQGFRTLLGPREGVLIKQGVLTSGLARGFAGGSVDYYVRRTNK